MRQGVKERGAEPTQCLINSNLIRPLTGFSTDLDSEEGGGGTWKKYSKKEKKTQLVSVAHKRKLQVALKSRHALSRRLQLLADLRGKYRGGERKV